MEVIKYYQYQLDDVSILVEIILYIALQTIEHLFLSINNLFNKLTFTSNWTFCIIC